MSSVPEAAALGRQSHGSTLKSMFAVCGLVIGWVATDVAYGSVVEQSRLRVVTSLLLPCFAAAILMSFRRFGRLGPDPVSRRSFAAGSTLLIAAAAADLAVTVSSDPNLSLEANPYIRALLDATPLRPGSVFAFVVLTQFLFVSAFVSAWWAFLRHRRVILETTHATNPRGWSGFIKAATGGARLTFRQWLLPLRPAEIPDPYYSVWPVALAICFGTSLFRLWAVAEWLDFVPAEPGLRAGVLVVGVGSTLIVYFAWLARSWRRGRAAALPDSGYRRNSGERDIF